MRALTIGSAMIDIITLVDADNIERMRLDNGGKSFLLLEQGRKVNAQSITTHIGGGACNVAVSLARQGWDVNALACVGDDLNGRAVAEHLTKNKVGVKSLTATENAATGVAVMVAAHDRNATIFVHRGANECLTQNELPPEAFAENHLVYVSALSNESADSFPYIVQQAKQAGSFVAVNPGIRQLTARADAFFGALPHINLLSLNRVEAEALVPGLHAQTSIKKDAASESVLLAKPEAPALLKRGLQFGGFDMSLITFAKAVHSLGVEWLLVTDGLDGAYLFRKDKGWWCPALNNVEVKGSAGAGDAFCSTLTASLVQEDSPELALVKASVNAASVVSEVNTTDGLLEADDLMAKVQACDLTVCSLF
jgi:ribokinase